MKTKFIFALASCYFFVSCTTFQNTTNRQIASTGPEQLMPFGDKAQQIDWRNLFYELNYINQFKMSVNDVDFKNRLHNSIYYTPEGFNSAYAQIVNESKTTKQAFHLREKKMGYNDSFKMRMRLYQQLNKAKQLGLDSFVNLLLAEADDSTRSPSGQLNEKNNYFYSAVGKEAARILNDYVIVVVPGFGSHTIKDYTWPEILRHANAYYQRPLVRPSYKKPGDENETFQKMEDFYGKNKTVGFDVVHPMGFELGYSMGKDEESGKALAEWLVRLKKLPAYSSKKFILIGYSKGTPISVNAFVNNPDISASISAIITMAGVAQGAVPANSFVRKAYESSRATSRQNLVDDLLEKMKRLDQIVTQSIEATKNMMAASQSNEKYFRELDDFIKTLISRGGVGFSNAEEKANITDKRKSIEGVVDMSNYESIQWNLKNYNDQKFKQPISIFNISMLTNIKDFVRPYPALDAYMMPPLIVPQFTNEGQLLYRYFSKDDVFLYLTSMAGFEESIGGLYDAQVAWLDTKSMALDSRPLTDSLDPKQIEMMKERFDKEGISLPKGFEKMPRRNLLKKLAGTYGGMNHINFVDLGEFRGTHWDVAFEQVYKPSIPNQEYYTHHFPRRALQASAIEMLAIYKQLGGLQ